MKPTIFFLGLSLSVPILVRAQITVSSDGNTSTLIHCTRFYISKPMRDFPVYKPSPEKATRESTDKPKERIHPKSNAFSPGKDYTDPVRQTSQGTKIGSIAPIVNFEGMDVSNLDPPDPNGAVGDSDYVETINSTYEVYDKTGHSIKGPIDLGNLWPIGRNQDGDPVVLFDKFADRWFISEFQDTAAPCLLYVAVSQTSDPTGAYYVWEFTVPNDVDPDYPKYSIWSDGYYITFQGFDFFSFQPIDPQEMGVLERNEMLKGDPNAGLILANLPKPPVCVGAYNSLFAAPKTLDCDASALPPFGTPEYLVYFENQASGGYSNTLVMYKLVTDTLAKTLTVTRADSFPLDNFNAFFSNGSLRDISQPGDWNGVDALDGTFNFRVPFMRFTGYNSVVLSNTVNLGNKVAGIRWYELRQNDTTLAWKLYQQSTYGPDDRVSRWNGAICQDYDGNIALEYSVADSISVYPGIRYTGRLAADPLDTMTFAEQTAIAGTSTLSGTGGRWGDYSELDIDPSDGLTFWATNEYGATSNNYTQLNRIFTFKLEPGLGVNEIKNSTEIKVYQSGNFLDVKASGLPNNDKLVIDLFDISGKQLTSQRVTPVSNMFETKINISELAKGAYFVRIGREYFQRVVKTIIY